MKFFWMPNSKIYSFAKKFFWKSSYLVHKLLKELLTVRWPCKPIILLIGHFEGLTEVQLNSWWKAASLRSITVWWCRLILLKGQLNFLQCLIQKFIYLQKNCLWKSPQLVHMVVRELLRLSDGLAIGSFYRLDISRI